MSKSSDKILALFAGYAVFLALFMGYKYFLKFIPLEIYEFKENSYKWHAIGLALSPFVVIIPSVLISIFNKSKGILFGVIFGILASISVFIIDTQIFHNIIGSDKLFATSNIFVNYFIIAVLAGGFGESIAKNR